MARIGLSEILEKTSQQLEEARGEYIRKHWNPSLGQLIRFAYDATFQWNLPEGHPPYVENPHLDQESNLYTELKRMYIFMKGSGDHIPQFKKELLFGGMLESLSRADAKLLIAAKDGVLPYGITQAFVLQELPGQLQHPRTEVEVAEVAVNEPFPEAVAEVLFVDTPPPAKPTPKKVPAKKVAPKRKPPVKKTVARKLKP